MDLEATAQALATDTALPDQVVETSTEEEDLSAAYDRITAAEPEQKPDPVEVEAKPEPVEAPTDIPGALRKHWATLDPEARDAIVASQREMSRKTSEAVKLAQGLDPIKNVLVKAAKEMPNLAGMRPEQVATEVFNLAQISAKFNSNPVETLVGLIDKHNMRDAIRQVLGGAPAEGQQTGALQQKIAALEAQLARVADPEYLREQVSAVTTQERVMTDVQSFAQSAEHWDALEPHIPQFIQIARGKLGESAPARDVLAAAYDYAVQIYLPDAKAKAVAAVEAAPVPDPEKAKAAIQAKSVNVTGRTEGKPKEMTEDERLSAAYDRAQRK
jgi:hypothetical protein